ncbi:MAG: HEAT repeat domain-containing protein [Phycisphaerae bacterium]|nr:HEAT repeat domain-containing protein [Phycisphaerae bacterium]
MIKQRTPLILVAAALLFSAVTAYGQTVPPASQQDELIAVLNAPDASRQQKAAACRQLSFIATKRAIPTLASLLADPDLNHMARYALETIPDPAVNDALLKALDTLQGKPLIGVMGSLGVRGETRAVAPLSERLTHQDPLVAQAAARALGQIGNAEAAQALSRAVSGAAGDTRLAVAEGLFRCAETTGGPTALGIYDRLLQLKTPHQVRAGALRGAILAREDGLDLLTTSLQSEDYILFSSAVQTAIEMSDARVTQVLSAALSGLPADSKILILGALAERGDPAALPTLVTAASRGNQAVRIAAIKAMPPIANAAALGTLVTLIKDPDAQIVQAAQTSLVALPGSAADQAVLGMLERGDPESQLQALELIGQRRMTDVAPALLKAARGNDAAVRVASIRMLGDLEDAVQFPVLIELLLGARSVQEVRAAEQTLSAVCTRDARPLPGQVTIRKAVYGAVGAGGSADVTQKVADMVSSGAAAIEASNASFGDPAAGVVKQLKIEFTANGVTQSQTVPEGRRITLLTSVTPPAYVNDLSAAMAQATSQQKRAILRVLRAAQGSAALDAVRTAMKDSDADVSSDATSIFCAWPSAEVLPEVLALARTATELKVKVVALRGAIRLIPLENITDAEKLAGFKAILPLIQRDDETRLLLGSLAEIPMPEALAITASYLDNAAVRNEACFAVIAIAEKMAPNNQAQIREALQRVLKTTTNAEVKKRAAQVLEKV